jgi:hypoxanthine phosphoribosyltransferase
MRRTPPSGPRGVLEVDWPFFGELCRALAMHVAREYDPEIVLGIAKAGVIPGVVVASILQREFSSMAVTRREAGAAPVMVAGPPPSIKGRRVLIVDETCDTGSTMKLALSEVRALRPAEVRTAVSFKTGDYTPDFYAFETESFIILPWDREIIQDGELIVRPDYA